MHVMLFFTSTKSEVWIVKECEVEAKVRRIWAYEGPSPYMVDNACDADKAPQAHGTRVKLQTKYLLPVDALHIPSFLSPPAFLARTSFLAPIALCFNNIPLLLHPSVGSLSSPSPSWASKRFYWRASFYLLICFIPAPPSFHIYFLHDQSHLATVVFNCPPAFAKYIFINYIYTLPSLDEKNLLTNSWPPYP